MKKILLYLLTFLIIYTPTFFSNNIVNYMLPFIYFIFTFFLTYNIPKKGKFSNVFRRVIFFLFLGAIYFFIRTLIAGTDLTDFFHLRIIQSLQFIVLLISMYNISIYLSAIGYNDEQKIEFLLKVCMIQFLFVAIMILFPNVRTNLLNHFYQNGKGNIFTISKRVYGIMSNYTFAGAIFHGVMAVIAYVYGLTKNNKYLLYIPELLIIVLLNGRTGLFICGIGIFISTIILVDKKSFFKIFKYFIIVIIASMLLFQLLKIIFPSTHIFIRNGFNDVVNILFNGEKTGNIQILSENFKDDINFKSLLIGNGYRIQNREDIPNNIEFNLSYSDMGYLNDMYMGGLPYMVMLYLPLIILIFTYNKNNKKEFALSMFLFFVLIFCNLKGEIFRSSMLVSEIIFIKSLIQESKEKEMKKI